MAFPAIPERLRAFFDRQVPGFWSWWQAANSFLDNRFSTNNDVTIAKPAKGIILTNSTGTITKRIRLNDIGDGIFIEDINE